MLTRSLSKLLLQSPTGVLGISYISQHNRAELHMNHVLPAPSLPNLPQEIFVFILSMLPLSDVGNLALCGSNDVRDKIITWIQSRAFHKKVERNLTFAPLFEEEGVDKWIDMTGQFGLMSKRVSMIYSTSARLRLLSKWYERLEDIIDVYCEDGPWKDLVLRIGLASSLATFSLGWDEVEYNKILGWVRDNEETALYGNNRRLLRIYFWQFVSTDTTKASWLSFILRTIDGSWKVVPKYFKEYQGAETLLCLFGPSTSEGYQSDLSPFKNEALTRLCGKPDYMVLDTSFVGGYHEAKNIFADLGKAVSTLLKSTTISRKFLTNMINSMFNSFFWHIDNQAACLLFSCEKLVKLYLSYIVNKDCQKFAHLLVALVVVCGRLSNHLNQGLDKILEWAIGLPEDEEKEEFAKELWREFSTRIQEDSVPLDSIHQFGVFITLMAGRNAKKRHFLVEMEIEE